MMVMAFYTGTLSASTLDDVFKIRNHVYQIKHTSDVFFIHYHYVASNDDEWMLFAICYAGVHIIDYTNNLVGDLSSGLKGQQDTEAAEFAVGWSP